MPMTINTNISAMTAQRNLGVNSMKSASSLAKLSSGSRVPSAKDDAAALAVGSQLRAEVNALKQASQNASQAVSMLQIADGALSTVGDMLVRMKALATQASSGQLGDSERALLDQEFDALRDEITRIAADTDFNGRSLLNGSDVVSARSELKLGELEGRGIDIAVDTAVTGADEVFRVDYDVTAPVGNLTVYNMTTGTSQTIDIGDAIRDETGEAATGLSTDLSAGDTVDVVFDSLGVTLTLDDRFDVSTDFGVTPTVTSNFTAGSLGGTATASLLGGTTISGTDFAALAGGADYDQDTGVLSINADANSTTAFDIDATAGLAFSTDGVDFTTSLTAVDPTTNDVFVRFGGAGDITDADGAAFMVLDVASITSTTTTGTGQSLDIDLGNMFRQVESTSSSASFTFRVGTGVSTTNDEITVSISSVTTSALGINLSDIGDSEANAESAITAVTDAITTVSSRRADIGASQSRLEFAGASIAVAIENVAAAQSALLDVDVSAEMTEFTSKQVLLQAGISMLAQANQQPGLLLRLLQ